jgi:molybdopterin/thiamine biosynthesis adenylyltransferase
MLSDDERKRYDRQLRIDGIGESGQEKLKNAKVVVVGAGGLGTPAATYLAAAGIGTLRIIDNDKVDLSNLNRQILHWGKDVGRNKVDSASEKLRGLNGAISVDPLLETIDEANASQLLSGFDVVVDGTDNLETRFALNKAILEKGIPFVHGAVYGFQGRVTTIVPGKTPCIRCLYRGPIPQQKPPVIGVTPGVVGILEATETIKLVLGVGDVLANRLLVYDALRMTFAMMTVRRNPTCPYCRHLVDT